MATIPNISNPAVTPPRVPANQPEAGDATLSTAVKAKGVADSPTNISVAVSDTQVDGTLPTVTYALDRNPPLKGQSAADAVNQFQQELSKLDPKQLDNLITNLFSFLAQLFNLLKQLTMKNRAVELENQFNATMAAASKLKQAASDTKTAGMIGAITGIAAGILSGASSGMAMRAGFSSKNLVKEFKNNNIEINKQAKQLQPQTKNAEPTIDDAIQAKKAADNAPATKLEISRLEGTQSGLKLQIDQTNNQAQALTQGGTAVGGIINSSGGVFSTLNKYQADMQTAAAKESDAASQKASAAAEDSTTFMQTAAQKFNDAVQGIKEMDSTKNNAALGVAKNMA